MGPTYSQHARDRMAERHISEDEVEYTLAHYYRSETSRTSGNTIYYGRPNGRRITVIVAPGTTPPRIVTVWED